MAGIPTLLVKATLYKVYDLPGVEKALKGILVFSLALMIPVFIFLSKWSLPKVYSKGAGYVEVKCWY